MSVDASDLQLIFCDYPQMAARTMKTTISALPDESLLTCLAVRHHLDPTSMVDRDRVEKLKETPTWRDDACACLREALQALLGPDIAELRVHGHDIAIAEVSVDETRSRAQDVLSPIEGPLAIAIVKASGIGQVFDDGDETHEAFRGQPSRVLKGYVLDIPHDLGSDTFVFLTSKEALTYLAAYVEERWAKEIVGEQPAEYTPEAIAHFFRTQGRAQATIRPVVLQLCVPELVAARDIIQFFRQQRSQWQRLFRQYTRAEYTEYEEVDRYLEGMLEKMDELFTKYRLDRSAMK